MAPLARDLKAHYGIEFFSIGGGLGIVYEASIKSGHKDWWQSSTTTNARWHQLSIQEYVDALLQPLGDLGLKILLEPGRLLVGNAGVLLTRVRYMKTTGQKKFAIVDAGMNDLIRPALYDAWHDVRNVGTTTGKSMRYEIVGPVCETGDFLARDRELALNEGDVLAIMSTGAYGMSMSSNYNTRLRAAEIMVDGDAVHVIRDRERVEQLLAAEHILP